MSTLITTTKYGIHINMLVQQTSFWTVERIILLLDVDPLQLTLVISSAHCGEAIQNDDTKK